MDRPSEEPPQSINPYKTLGLSKTASSAEVKTAYKKLALKHHPDKVAQSDRASAHTNFQEIAFAYAILSDPTRRDRYDSTGSTSESVSDDFNWKSFFKAQYAETVTLEKLDNLKATYQGSEDEKRDVLDAYKRRKGNLNKMFKDIMLSNVLEDEDRFRSIIDTAIAANEVPTYDAYLDPDQQGRKERRRKAKKEEAEAQEVAKKLGVHDALFGNGRAEGQEKKGLADIIQQRQKARAATFLDDLTAKYVNGASHAATAGSRKRKSEVSEEEDTTFTARQRKKGKLAKKLAKQKKSRYASESGDDEDIDVDMQPVDEPSEEAFKEMASRPRRQRRRQAIEEDSEAEESLGDEDTEEEVDEIEELKEVKPVKKTKKRVRSRTKKRAKGSAKS